MNILAAYGIIALILLALAAKIIQPPKWKRLPEQQVKFLRFGCFLGSCMLLGNIIYHLL